MRKHILFSIFLLIGVMSTAQEPVPQPDTGEQQECTMYTLNNPGPMVEQLHEEYVCLDRDTFEGFWPTGNSIFIAPGLNAIFEFSSCTTIAKVLPRNFINRKWLYDYGYIDQYLPSAPNYHYTQPMQLMGFASYSVGRYLLGYAEGLNTIEGPERIDQGLHYKSREAHRTEFLGEIFAYGGMSTFVTGSVLWELKLRECAPRKGFWYNTGFWPTVGRNAIGLGVTLLSGYVSAQTGYNAVVDNP